MDEDFRKQFYIEYYKAIWSSLRNNNDRYDRALLTLSTALLGFSLVFIKDVVKDLNEALCFYLLKISWFLFILTIIITFFGFLVSNKAGERQLEIVNNYLNHLESKDRSEKPDERNRANQLTTYLNFFAGIFFISAVIITFIFVSINI